MALPLPAELRLFNHRQAADRLDYLEAEVARLHRLLGFQLRNNEWYVNYIAHLDNPDRFPDPGTPPLPTPEHQNPTF